MVVRRRGRDGYRKLVDLEAILEVLRMLFGRSMLLEVQGNVELVESCRSMKDDHWKDQSKESGWKVMDLDLDRSYFRLLICCRTAGARVYIADDSGQFIVIIYETQP